MGTSHRRLHIRSRETEINSSREKRRGEWDAAYLKKKAIEIVGVWMHHYSPTISCVLKKCLVSPRTGVMWGGGRWRKCLSRRSDHTYNLTQTAKRKSYQYPPCSEVDALSGVKNESKAKEGEEDGIGRIGRGIAIERARHGAFFWDAVTLSLARDEDVRGMRNHCGIFESCVKGRRWVFGEMVGICSNRGGCSKQREDEIVMNVGVESSIVEVSLYIRRCEGCISTLCGVVLGWCMRNGGIEGRLYDSWWKKF